MNNYTLTIMKIRFYLLCYMDRTYKTGQEWVKPILHILWLINQTMIMILILNQTIIHIINNIMIDMDKK